MLLKILAVVIFIRQIIEAKHGEYECGPHGKFEYCIDEVPGCIVGCYCHPGYYFDTESKICESNAELTKGSRRRFQSDEGARFQFPSTTSQPNEQTTNNSINVLDKKVNKITGTVDELTDWLYGEFFKTIENQVISNKTGHNLEDGRRKNKAKDDSKKLRKRKSPKRGQTVVNDDDVINIHSSDENQCGSASPDDSDCYSSCEDDAPDCSEPESDENRKILVIHKRPPPPLPPFMLLPGPGTNFYPNFIPGPMMSGPMMPGPMMPGSVMPGPMLPMPPLMAPYPPSVIVIQPGNMTNGNEKPDCLTTVTDNPVTTVTTTTTVPTTTTNARSRTSNKSKKRTDKIKRIARDMIFPPSGLKSIDFVAEEASPMIAEGYQYRKSFNPYKVNPGSLPNSDAVKFKYLVDLIHKMDENNANSISTIPRNSEGLGIDYANTEKPKTPLKPDEQYYSKLGKEIAALVLKPDLDKKSQSDTNTGTEIVPKNRRLSIAPFSNENIFRSGSYWERFVRSLQKYKQELQDNPMLVDASNEELREIENIVEKTATVAPVLSLMELESIVKVMDDDNQSKNVDRKQGNVKARKKSVNIKIYTNNIKEYDKHNYTLRAQKLSLLQNNSTMKDHISPSKRFDSNYINNNNNIINSKNSNGKFTNTIPNPIIMNYTRKSTKYFTDDHVIQNELRASGHFMYKPLYFVDDFG